MPLLRGGLGEQIQPVGEVAVARVEIDSLLRPDGRDVIEQLLRQIAMRVDEAHAVALQDELEDEIAQQRGLSRTRFADDISVVACIRHFKIERRFTAAPRLPHADVKVIVHAHALHELIRRTESHPSCVGACPAMAPGKRFVGEPGG